MYHFTLSVYYWQGALKMNLMLCILIGLGVFNFASSKPKQYLIETVDETMEEGPYIYGKDYETSGD